MKKNLILISILCFSLQTFSQKNFGLEAGTTFSTFNTKDEYQEMKLAIGPRVGINYQKTITKWLDFETGIYYMQKGQKSKNEATAFLIDGRSATVEETYKYKLNYIELPLNLKFNYRNWFVYSGIYLAFGIKMNYIEKGVLTDNETGEIINEYKEKENLIDIETSPVYSTNKTESWDYGLDFGVGYKLNKFLIKAGLDWGFQDILTDYPKWYTNTDLSISRNRSAYLSVAYQFKSFENSQKRHSDSLFSKQKGFIFNLQLMPWDAKEYQLAAIVGYKYKKLVYFAGYERSIFTYESTDSYNLKAGIYSYPHKNLSDFKVYYQSFLTYKFIDAKVLVGNIGLGFDYFFFKNFGAGLQFSWGYGKYLESNQYDEYGTVINFSFTMKYFLVK